MPKVSSSNSNLYIRANVGSEVMNSQILEMYSVRRGLDFPASIDKVGVVLSHSGCIAKTSYGYILIEYMGTGQVFITPCNTYKPGENIFRFRKFHFVHDDLNPQVPSPDVTIIEFVNSMIEFMKGKPFNAATHSCHHARCWTMAKYGMVSEDPDAIKTNTVFQAFLDYFSYSNTYTQKH